MSEIILSQEKEGRCHACGCVGPNPGSETLSEEQITAELSSLSVASIWVLADDHKSISRRFTCRNWQAAMNVMNEVGSIAESKDIQHHPDLHLTNYRELEICIHTHAAGGLTKYDFLLARALDSVKIDFSPKWLKEHPVAQSCQIARVP